MPLAFAASGHLHLNLICHRNLTLEHICLFERAGVLLQASVVEVHELRARCNRCHDHYYASCDVCTTNLARLRFRHLAWQAVAPNRHIRYARSNCTMQRMFNGCLQTRFLVAEPSAGKERSEDLGL